MKRNYLVRFETEFDNESFQITTQSSSDNDTQTNVNLKRCPSTTSIFSLLKL